jgi:methylated-DNA-[protein]-cysteine S-methyltransferase
VISNEIPINLQDAVTQLNAYFKGTRTDFDFVLNPKGTAFQQKVWKLLLDIPYGKTRTYLQQSKILGNIEAIRAVASANGKNPLWIVVPCHRVIGTDGSLTGYAGGLWRKKWLLEHENPTTQQSLF